VSRLETFAEDAGTHRHAISKTLAANCVELCQKRHRLTDNAVTDAASGLYAMAWTFAQLADKFGVGQETMRRELHDAGIDVRPRGGRH
jgi:hypothetical protein